MSFLWLLYESTDVCASLFFQVAIVHHILSGLKGYYRLHGVVERQAVGRRIDGSEKGGVQGVEIVKGGDRLLGRVDFIAKLINLEIAAGFVDAFSGAVVKGSSKRCVVELFPIIHV